MMMRVIASQKWKNIIPIHGGGTLCIVSKEVDLQRWFLCPSGCGYIDQKGHKQCGCCATLFVRLRTCLLSVGGHYEPNKLSFSNPLNCGGPVHNARPSISSSRKAMVPGAGFVVRVCGGALFEVRECESARVPRPNPAGPYICRSLALGIQCASPAKGGYSCRLTAHC